MFILPLIAGLMIPLAFAPFSWPLLGALGLVIFMLLLEGISARKAAIYGLWFGLGMFGLGVSWVYNSLHDFGSANAFVAGSIAAGLVLINAFYIAILAGVYRRIFNRCSIPLRFLLILPALWVLAEWSRSWILTGFPWLLLGYSQVDTWLAGYAPVGGNFFTSGIAVVLAGAIATLLISKGKIWRTPLLSILLLLGIGKSLLYIEWTQPTGDTIKVSLIQGNVPQEVKMQPENLGISLNQYLKLSRTHYTSDLIVWPETAIPTFPHRIPGFLEQLAQELESTDTELVTGLFAFNASNQRYYNSIHKLGETKAVYHKQRLVPFGEYMPFREVLVFLNNYIDIPMSDIAAGEPLPSVSLAGVPAGLSICYESAYSEIYRQQLPGAEFLINISNDAWFGRSLAPHQHLEMARLRALEVGRYLLRATNTGISAIIGPKGELLQSSPQFEDAVVNGTIQPLTSSTPFALYGDWPAISLSFAILLLSWWKYRPRKRYPE